MAIPSTIELLTELVAIPSVSSTESLWDQSNAPIIDRLADVLNTLGAEVSVHEVVQEPRKLNLIARFGQGQGGLVFSGHTDTVPFDAARWATDPFTLTDIDGRLHGLGSTDMKGFIAAAVTVASQIDQKKLKKPLYIVATCDEESTMSGGRWLQDSDALHADYVVIGEPTDLVPVRAHKGHLAHRLCAHGHSGHSSNPDAGINALDAMYEAMGVLMQWRSDLKLLHRDESFAVPYPTLNFGRLAGGDAVNRICPEAVLDFDLRPLPGMAIEKTYDDLRKQIEKIKNKSKATLELQEMWPGTPAFATPIDTRLVSTASELSGKPAICVNYGTEAPYYRALGSEVIVMGPGSIDRAHQPNEYVTREELKSCEQFLLALVYKLLC